MRQAGYLAAAGIYALDNHFLRLADDHRRAKEIGNLLQQLPWIASVEPVETNILIFSIQSYLDEKVIIQKLKEKGIHISAMGHGKLRIVTHLDYRQVMHDVEGLASKIGLHAKNKMKNIGDHNLTLIVLIRESGWLWKSGSTSSNKSVPAL